MHCREYRTIGTTCCTALILPQTLNKLLSIFITVILYIHLTTGITSNISVSTIAIGPVENGFGVHHGIWLCLHMNWLLRIVERFPFKRVIHLCKTSVIPIYVGVTTSTIGEVVPWVPVTYELHFSALGSYVVLMACESALPGFISGGVGLVE